MGPNELPKHDPNGMSTSDQQTLQEEAYYNTLGSVPLEQLQDQQPAQPLIYPSHNNNAPITFAYPSSNVIRFASKREQRHQQQLQETASSPESFENFDFTSLPGLSNTSQQYHERTRAVNTNDEMSSHEQPIPHSSGMTAISNMTSDDSATLIGRNNNNNNNNTIQHMQQHLEIAQEYSSISSPPSSPSPHYQEYHYHTQHHLQEQHEPYHHHPIKTPSPIITHNINSHRSPPPPIIVDRSTTIVDNNNASRQTKLIRNYKQFPGQNKFFCGGRFMTSREYWAFILALILLIAPSVLFGIFTCPFIWEKIHPSIPIVFAYLFVLSLTSMIKTSWTDPGIIPRDLDPFPALERYEDPGSPYSDATWHHGVPIQKEVRIKDRSWTLRYCDTCRIYRPPRASHCRQCDNCVEVEDHHCIWLNNCIGVRNYRPFFVFITTATLCCLIVIVFSIVHLLLEWKEQEMNATFNSVFNAAPVSFILAIICIILLLMVGGLTLYHCSLILRGITTHEQLRASVMTKHSDLSANPYNKGNPVLNMAYVLCRPRPKSYLRRRKYSPTVN